MKAFLGIRAKGRDIIESNEGYQVREGSACHGTLSGVEMTILASEIPISGRSKEINQSHALALRSDGLPAPERQGPQAVLKLRKAGHIGSVWALPHQERL